jgi:hypothetical protein
MSELISSNACDSLEIALSSSLPFKIAMFDPPAEFTEFVVGRAEYGADLDAYLNYHLISASSEQSVVALDSNWVSALSLCLGLTVFQNQTSHSSAGTLRPDFTIYKSGALVMRVEEKADSRDLPSAKNELVDKLSDDAIQLFPFNQDRVLGLAISSFRVEMYFIAWNYAEGRFSLSELVQAYITSSLEGRVKFVVDLFKIARWMAAINKPNKSFHLIPNQWIGTDNHHRVMWVKDGLLKQLNRHKVSEDQLDKMVHVMSQKLDHVECGELSSADKRIILIKTVGVRVEDFFRDVAQNMRIHFKNKLLQDVQLGLDELHSIGYAHCDLCIKNVFYDAKNCRFFLDDLEYVTDCDSSPPLKAYRTSRTPQNARELDEFEFDDSFRGEVHQL